MEQLVLVVVNLRLEFHSVSFRCGLGEEFEFLDPELFLFIRLRFSLFWHRVRVLVRRPARDVRDTERSPAPCAGGATSTPAVAGGTRSDGRGSGRRRRSRLRRPSGPAHAWPRARTQARWGTQPSRAALHSPYAAAASRP